MNISLARAVLLGALLIALALISRLIGCAQVLEAPGPTTSSASISTTSLSSSTTLAPLKGYREYYPNADGSSWTYNRLFSDGTRLTEKITYAGTTTFLRQTVQIARRETFTPSSVSTSENLFKVTASAVYFVENVSGINLLTVAFGFPLYVGGTTGLTKVLSLEDVTVPAGSFKDCFKLSSSDGSYTYRSWLAPGVGMVKAEKANTVSISTAELTGKNF